MTKYQQRAFDKIKVNEMEKAFRNYQISGIILDGIKIKTLEELREHFDMDVILFYFASGRLLSWFDAHYYEIEADRLEKLSESDQNLQEKLCNIIGVDPNVFVEEVALRNKQIEELKEYTDDLAILEMVDRIAFNQEELSILLDKDASTIYLFNNTFHIPLRLTGKTYIGIGNVTAIIRNVEQTNFDSLNISFQNIQVKKVTV